MNINNLLEIENDAVTQSLLMKAHLLENLVLYNTTEEERIDNLKEIATIYEFLQQKDPKR